MRASRRFHVAAVAELLLGVPTVLSSLLVVALLGRAVSPQAWWVFPVVWLVSGAIVFVPATDRVLAAGRRPACSLPPDSTWSCSRPAATTTTRTSTAPS